MRRCSTLLGVTILVAACGGWEIRNAPALPGPVVCFGDSLTFGTGAPPEASYPSVLARRLDREVINTGRPGDTTSSALRRLDRDVLAHSPGVVLITLGGNDLKNGVDADVTFANLAEIVTRLQEEGALVVLGGIDVPLFGRGFADRYHDLARRTGCVLVPNVFADIMGHVGRMSDRIHPNARGYAVMADHFTEAVEPHL
jgi:lysophospholipase L1-like esterase